VPDFQSDREIARDALETSVANYGSNDLIGDVPGDHSQDADALHPSYHYGIYGRIIVARRVLLVRKTRGPYKGLLDVPGGTPESGESRHETLNRELREEVGGEIASRSSWRSCAFTVEHSSEGDLLRFHHNAHWADVTLVSAPDLHYFSDDTGGAQWFDLDGGNLSELSTLAKSILPMLGRCR
jgi:8-oxo-dGTP pyrophosphatase MutT (NUDIX family)